MDKDNLYYIVEKGTNCKERIACDVYIGEREKSLQRAEDLAAIFKNELVIMSIREYEEKFTDKEADTYSDDVKKQAKELFETGSKYLIPEVKKEPASYNPYSTGKHLLGMYNNKVIVLSSEGYHTVDKIITDKHIVSKIQSCLKEPVIWNWAVEELIEKAI